MQRNTCLTCEDFSESSSRPDGRDRTQAAGPQARVAARPQRVWLVVLEIGHLPELFEVPEIPVPHGPARIWLAARRARPQSAGIPAERGSFLLKGHRAPIDPAESIRAISDGMTAGMRCDDADRGPEAVSRLPVLLDADSGELLALATAPCACAVGNTIPAQVGIQAEPVHARRRHPSAPLACQPRYTQRPAIEQCRPDGASQADMTIRDQPHVINNRYSARRGRQIPIKLTGIPIRRSGLV